jgi:hypothetical protein
MQIAQNMITRTIVRACSFRVIADHSLFCFFATNPMKRPMPVPAKVPSATISRISNIFGDMQASLPGCQRIHIKPHAIPLIPGIHPDRAQKFTPLLLRHFFRYGS